jgi:hypothetical protein
MKTAATVTATVFVACLLTTTSALAGACVTKGAIATAENEKSAKWYALETMVQSVSWSLWPNFVATNTVDGYTIRNERYKCTGEGGGTTCRATATFCKN